VTLGLVYQDMEKKNAVTPQTAAGMPNVGLFVGFNLPVYRNKYRAGVCEAEARRAADIQLYEDERDQANRDVKDLFVQAKVQQNVIRLLSENNLVAAKRVFELTASEFRTGNAGTDLLGVLASWRDVLQVELQLAQLESELGKTLAGLERAVGVQLNEHPPDPTAAPTPASAPPPSSGGSPFRPGVRPEEKAVDDRQGEARSEPTPLPNPEARP
jgi:outer membrane protein TolC